MDALAGDLLGRGQSAERDLLEDALAHAFLGPQALGGSLALEGPGGNGIDLQAETRPLDRERARHRQHAGFGAGGVDHAGHARPGVGGDDVEDLAASAFDHAASEIARAEEGTVEHDAEHAAPGARRESFRRAQKIAGGVVDQQVQGPTALAELERGAFDLGRLAHVEHDRLGLPTLAPCFLEQP